MTTSADIQGKKSRQSGLWYALLVIPLIVYLKGLAPSVVLGDTGDFLTAGWIWGVAHPPGYPLYTMLVGLFERLPIPPLWIQVEEYSPPAWRANLLSALFAVGAIAALFALVNRLTRRPLAALIASGALAFSRVFWWHAEMAENDALSCLFIVLILLLAVRWVQERRRYDPYLLALMLGLAISHHQAVLLFLPAVFVYLLLGKAIAFKGRQWVALFVVFALGLTPFAYLPLVRYNGPDGPLNLVTEAEYDEISLNEPGRILTERFSTTPPPEYFLNYVGRTIYSRQRVYTHTEQALGEDKTTTADVLRFYLKLARQDFGIVLLVVGAIGLFFGWRAIPRRRSATMGDDDTTRNWSLLAIAYALYLLVIHFYPSGDILRAPMYNLEAAGPGLMLPLEVVFAALIGIAIGAITDLLEGGREGIEPGRITVVGAAVTALGIVAVVWAAIGSYPAADRSKNTLAHEYALNTMDSCPDGATLIVAGDEIYAFEYLHLVYPDPETGRPGYRTDLRLTTWAGKMESLSELADVGGAMAAALARISVERPGVEIDTTFFNSRFLEEPLLQGFVLARRGIVFAFVTPDRALGLSPAADELAEQTGVAAYVQDLPGAYRWDFWGGNAIVTDIPLPESRRRLWAPEADIQWRIGEMLLFYGSDALLKGDANRAAAYFRQMVLVEPDNPVAREYLGVATGR